MSHQPDEYCDKDWINSIDADRELGEYLQTSAREAGITVAELLRQVLHLNPLTQEPGFEQLFGTAGSELRRLLMHLDHRLRILNPGLHYVFRSTYLGYRREGGTAATAVSERTQIFVSVVPRSDRLRLVLPVDPARYAGQPGCRVLSGQGHHGVGELQVDVPDEDALDRFFKTFRDWLGPPSAEPPRMG
jgi:predicted transport protein